MNSVPFSGGTGTPRLAVPADACDCHMHIFDGRHPFAEGAPAVPRAGVEDYKLLQKRLGTSRAVVVAPSMYGLDNRCTIGATAALGPQARCVVTLGEDTPAAEVSRLHAHGARGFRFNLYRSKTNRIDTLRSIAERVAPFGWHAQIMLDADQLIDGEPHLRDLPIPVVLDHMARLPQSGGRSHPAYAVMQSLLDRGNTWLKLSLATAVRLVGSPAEAELHVLARSWVSLAPERLLWGSDWPHVMATLESRRMPDDAALLDFLQDWAPEPELRRRILVDNPAKLYGF
ncbi:amidohydrolase family protein [Candidimonas humi]|uniref:Amidohydrolase family protein n=1 Tax=Candidimonas humi TaxID=683355 RepID=A0ABV8P4C6_9BURK|nr:amidohydrolase family protein [Candidimonas humi]MBV6307232.1 amidohydrolase family protein [Candidimonas humi]